MATYRREIPAENNLKNAPGSGIIILQNPDTQKAENTGEERTPWQPTGGRPPRRTY